MTEKASTDDRPKKVKKKKKGKQIKPIFRHLIKPSKDSA